MQNLTQAFSERLVTPTVGTTAGQAWRGASGHGVAPLGIQAPMETGRQLVCSHQAGWSRPHSGSSVYRHHGRVSCPHPPPQPCQRKKPVPPLVLPSWSLPLKIFILRRKRMNVTLMCIRQKGAQQMGHPSLRGWGPPPMMHLRTLCPIKSPSNVLCGWHPSLQCDWPGGFHQPLFCHPSLLAGSPRGHLRNFDRNISLWQKPVVSMVGQC